MKPSLVLDKDMKPGNCFRDIISVLQVLLFFIIFMSLFHLPSKYLSTVNPTLKKEVSRTKIMVDNSLNFLT